MSLEVFCNQERSGYEEIVSYGPRWWTDFREMDAVYRLAGWTLDLAALWLEKIINNQFVSCADEATIIMLEKLLKIQYEGDPDLEERRSVVLTYLYGTQKLSRSNILSTMKDYTGMDGDVYWMDDVLYIYFPNDTDLESIELVKTAIARRLPAHINYVFLMSDIVEESEQSYYTTVTATRIHVEGTFTE